jgi:hypothetical protein
MATRALVGYLENGVLTSTYNHYDGYPENLGQALNKFYNTSEKAKEIANRGYISYVDPETGEIEAVNQDTPDKLDLNKMDPNQAIEAVAGLIDSYGADYAYFFTPNASKWDHIKNYGIRQMSDALEGILFGDFDNTYDEEEMNENYQTKWKKFLNNEGMDMPGFEGTSDQLSNLSLYQKKPSLSQVMSQAFYQLQDEPGELLSAYKESLANDIRINGEKQYADYTVEDFIEDYNNYVGDKMDY